jgi:anti-anti-sigma factor
VNVRQIIRSARLYGVSVVSVSGEIDIATADAFRRALAAESAEECVVVSLLEVDYIDSSGLGVLIREHKVRQARGQQILVILPVYPTSRVFEITQLNRVLACFGDLVSAIQAARGDARPPKAAAGGLRAVGNDASA